MGLENGIIAKRKNEDKFETYCYWRKCHGVREDIVEILNKRGIDFTIEDYEINIDKNILVDILNLLEGYNESNWTHSLWDWSEYEETNEVNIGGIKRLLSQNQDMEIKFYNSY